MKDWLNILKNQHKKNKYYYEYSNRIVRIHHKNNNDEWYVIDENGSVAKDNLNGDYKMNFCHINNLTGDDFELFNIVQVIKAGYLVFELIVYDNAVNDIRMRKIVSQLHHYIDALDDSKHTAIPYLCGGSCWTNGVTDYITYYAVNGIEVHVRTIKNLCQENVECNYYDAKSIPFIKSMDNNTTIHVSFVHMMYKNKYEEINARCNEALEDLLTYMNTIGIKCKWVECKTKYPVFL